MRRTKKPNDGSSTQKEHVAPNLDLPLCRRSHEPSESLDCEACTIARERMQTVQCIQIDPFCRPPEFARHNSLDPSCTQHCDRLVVPSAGLVGNVILGADALKPQRAANTCSLQLNSENQQGVVLLLCGTFSKCAFAAYVVRPDAHGGPT